MNAAADTTRPLAPGRRRTAARLAAVQALYQLELAGASVDSVVGEFIHHRLGRDGNGDGFGDADPDFFAALVRGTASRQEALDRLIADALTPDWPLERLESVLRAILRAGAYELVACPEVPTPVVICEYLDICHAFFGGREPGLVNGVLDKLARTLRSNAAEEGGAMAAPHLGEFARIARFFAPLAAPGALGLLDDVALIDGPPGEQYVLKTDAIVEGVHFLPDDPPGQVAQKLLRVNLSDLAAKGAIPVGYLLVTALPAARDETWLEAFAAGLAADQARYGIGLLGGDTVATPGPATLAVAAVGRVAAGSAVLRRGALAGHRVYVSGTLGDAALGVMAAKGDDLGVAAGERDFLIDRFRLPQPRLALGPRLIGLAAAMMDISDGLVADLGHICSVSGVAAVVEAERLPLSPAARAALRRDPSRLAAVLGGGDDYELLFAASPDAEARLLVLAHEVGVPITMIGRIEAGQGVRVLDRDGAAITVKVAGYEHV